MSKVSQNAVKLIADMKDVYRNYGKGVKPWLVTFAVSVAVAVIGYGIVGVQVIREGTLAAASFSNWALPIAWLASMLALRLSMDIRDQLHDNYRAKTHNLLIIQEIADNQATKGLT